MDTERDENQNLKNDIDTRQDNLQRGYNTDESRNQTEGNNEFDHNLPEDDYTDDQNNSSTGYNEKLLEKKFNQDQANNESDIETEFENDDDLIVKNGNIIIDKIPSSNKNQVENDNKNNSFNKTDK
ncbi:hypothetical protein [Flavobacterium aestuarii]|uniref:hypothetical protein n=1 Tax=Flavobacterium aestuarii TaxID=3149227 RepID=UPI0032B60A2B